MKADEQLEILESLVALKLEERVVSEGVRRSLVAVQERMIDRLLPTTRKRVAAKLLQISVPALDRWIQEGLLATVASPSAPSRSELPTRELVAVAAEARTVHHVTGSSRPVGVALRSLREQRWREHEVANACTLVAFTTGIGVAAWNQRSRA